MRHAQRMVPRTGGPKVMKPMLVYLDTQQWNYLIDATDETPDVDRAMLQRAIHRQQIAVVGSLDLLQELMSASFSSPEKYSAMADLFFGVVRGRLLHPLSRRHSAEATHGGLLPERRRYLRLPERESLYAASQGLADVLDMADEIKAEKDAFKASEDQLRAQAKSAIESAGERVTGPTVRAWFEGLDVAEWISTTIEEGVHRGEYTLDATTPVTALHFPSAWAFTTIRLARLTYTLGEGRKIKASDLADAHHVAAGPYFDVLVTDDKELLLTLELVPNPPFRWMTSAQFVIHLLGQ
jgi:hypothetical protein